MLLLASRTPFQQQKRFVTAVAVSLVLVFGAGLVRADTNEVPVNSQFVAHQAGLAVGPTHTCALTTSGTVKCWGRNGSGQLGNGTTTDSLLPVDVHTSSNDTSPLSNVKALTIASSHTCALTISGTVKCWGSNGEGRLGDGTENASSTPVNVHTSSTDPTPLSGITAISSSESHTCALTTGGSVKCWGFNDFGRLGDGTTMARLWPVDVHTSSASSTPLSGIVAIATGSKRTCALTTNGTVKCWGGNRLGNGTTSSSTTPVDVLASGTPSSNPVILEGITAITDGNSHTCALTTNGTVKCWGNSTGRGQLGNNSTSDANNPVDVHTSATESTPLSGVTALSAGADHTCAVINNGTVKCWGYNFHGQLGNTNVDFASFTAYSTTPVTVQTSDTDTNPLTNIVALSSGGNVTCALNNTSQLLCWGQNSNGGLGNQQTTNSQTPVFVSNSGTPLQVFGPTTTVPEVVVPTTTVAPAELVATSPSTSTVVSTPIKRNSLPSTGSNTSIIAAVGITLLCLGLIASMRRQSSR